MKGKIMFVVHDSQKIEGHVQMESVSPIDKVLLLHAFCGALDIDQAEVLVALAMRKELDDSAEKVEIDLSKMGL